MFLYLSPHPPTSSLPKSNEKMSSGEDKKSQISYFKDALYSQACNQHLGGNNLQE